MPLAGSYLHQGWILEEAQRRGLQWGQRKVINRLLDGFEGKLTSSKWAKLAKCSQDTTGRDINDLLERKILAKEEAGGRSTSYVLKTSRA